MAGPFLYMPKANSSPVLITPDLCYDSLNNFSKTWYLIINLFESTLPVPITLSNVVSRPLMNRRGEEEDNDVTTVNNFHVLNVVIFMPHYLDCKFGSDFE